MRLYLSSENFGKHKDKLVELTNGKMKVAYICNAKDYDTSEDRSAKVVVHRQQFIDLGFTFTEIDLRNYFNDKLSETMLKDYGLVWCAGGNTFLLRSAFKQSGLDKIITKMLANDELAYGGSSAGSVLTGPTLVGADNGEEPSEVSRIYSQEIMWDGLNIVPFVCIPHWGTEWFSEDAKKMQQQLEKDNVPYKILQDGQVFIIDGKKQELFI